MIHSEAKDFPDAKFDFYTDAVPFQGALPVPIQKSKGHICFGYVLFISCFIFIIYREVFMTQTTRIALIGILIEQEDAVEPVNQALHEYSDYIVGRMGIPYREKEVNIISVVLDAPENIISTLSGRLGMIQGVTVKSMFTKKK